VGYPELAICVDEYLSLQDFVQTWLVHKIEVGDSSVPVYKTIKKGKKYH